MTNFPRFPGNLIGCEVAIHNSSMTLVEMTEVESRLGCYSVIKLGQAVLISPCDTRTRILEALSKRPATGEELAQEMDVSYSCIMDHMELLEKLGIVEISRRETKQGRRKIHFHLSEDPLRGIQELFITTAERNGPSPADERQASIGESDELMPSQAPATT